MRRGRSSRGGELELDECVNKSSYAGKISSAAHLFLLRHVQQFKVKHPMRSKRHKVLPCGSTPSPSPAPTIPYIPIALDQRCIEGVLYPIPIRERERAARMMQSVDASQRCYDRCVDVGFMPVGSDSCFSWSFAQTRSSSSIAIPLVSFCMPVQVFHFSVQPPASCWCCGAVCTLIPANTTVRHISDGLGLIPDGAASLRSTNPATITTTPDVRRPTQSDNGAYSQRGI